VGRGQGHDRLIEMPYVLMIWSGYGADMALVWRIYGISYHVLGIWNTFR
jgi:hypothetical protein